MLAFTPAGATRADGLTPAQRGARAGIVRAFRGESRDALAVAWCESRWTPTAVGGANVGLFQINYVHHAPGETWPAFVGRLSRPAANIALALRLSSSGTDWRSWACQP